MAPTLKPLATDTFQYVRIALADNILTLCPLIGKTATNEHILPLFLQLLRDESSEVRLSIFKTLEHLNEVIGIDSLSQSILPAINDMVAN